MNYFVFSKNISPKLVPQFLNDHQIFGELVSDIGNLFLMLLKNARVVELGKRVKSALK